MLSCFDKNCQPSLYIHIPFCKTKCDYCAFYSECNINNESIKKYFDRLNNEITSTRSYFNNNFSTVFIGGGSPNIPNIVWERVNNIALVFKDKVEEITIEGNLENIDDYFLNTCNVATRLSFGIQRFLKNDRLAIGRKSEMKEQLHKLLTYRKNNKNFPIINFDFIINIPNETKESIKNNFELFFNFLKDNSFEAPEHLSVYSLSIEKNTPLYSSVNKGIIKLPNEDEECENLEYTWKLLKEYGYEHYEISAFCKNNNKCKHNMNYWKLKDYIGLGTSSASRAFANGYGWDVKQEQKINDYINSDVFSGYKIDKLSKKDIATEIIAVGIRTNEGINIKDLEGRTGIKLTVPTQNAFIPNKENIILKEKEFLKADYWALKLIEKI